MRALHPKLVPWLHAFNATVDKLVAAGFKANPTNAREGLANLTKAFVTKIPDIAWMQDDYVAAPGYDVPVRIYHPAPDKALPVLIYFHGGGHMAGSVTVYDPICRKLALASQHIVVSVEYRLAPECPYPAGLTDACNVVKYIWKTLAERKLNYERTLAVGGDSGGGALAASVSGLAQFDASLSIKRQFLVYPSVDYTLNTPSIQENSVGYLLQTGKIIWYFDSYFSRGEDRKAASPLFWDFTPKMPETLVVTAEFCPLRDEGARYAAKLHAAGVKVEHIHLDDMIHTFMNLEDLVPERCAKVYDDIGRFLRA